MAYRGGVEIVVRPSRVCQACQARVDEVICERNLVDDEVILRFLTGCAHRIGEERRYPNGSKGVIRILPALTAEEESILGATPYVCPLP